MESIDSVYEKAPPYSSDSTKVPEFVSEADYWQFYYEYSDESYEWNNGKLEKKPMSDQLSYLLYLWFSGLISEYFKAFPGGSRMGHELGFKMEFDNKRVIRKPDMAIIHRDNPTPFELTDRTYKGICDICIEFLSDSTKQEEERDTVQKKEEYAKAGVQEYFILDGKYKKNAFYRLIETDDVQTSSLYQPIDPGKEGIIHSQILPQFAFRVEHLKSLPDYKDLMDDPVYRPFILKDLQAERQAKEAALESLKQARQAEGLALKQLEQDRLEKTAMQAELERLRAEIQKER